MVLSAYLQYSDLSGNKMKIWRFRTCRMFSICPALNPVASAKKSILNLNTKESILRI